jgi:hypothetical protein
MPEAWCCTPLPNDLSHDLSLLTTTGRSIELNRDCIYLCSTTQLQTNARSDLNMGHFLQVLQDDGRPPPFATK